VFGGSLEERCQLQHTELPQNSGASMLDVKSLTCANKVLNSAIEHSTRAKISPANLLGATNHNQKARLAAHHSRKSLEKAKDGFVRSLDAQSHAVDGKVGEISAGIG
jgi:hypothetical protein